MEKEPIDSTIVCVVAHVGRMERDVAPFLRAFNTIAPLSLSFVTTTSWMFTMRCMTIDRLYVSYFVISRQCHMLNLASAWVHARKALCMRMPNTSADAKPGTRWYRRRSRRGASCQSSSPVVSQPEGKGPSILSGKSHLFGVVSLGSWSWSWLLLLWTGKPASWASSGARRPAPEGVEDVHLLVQEAEEKALKQDVEAQEDPASDRLGSHRTRMAHFRGGRPSRRADHNIHINININNTIII